MNTISFTQKGVDDLKKEQEILKTQRKAAVIDLRKAREMGDLSENGYYKAAKFKLNDIDRRIRMVTALVKNAYVPPVTSKNTIDIGCRVTIDNGEEKKTYLMVGGYESDPSLGKLSVISPIGKALQGRKKGESVVISSPLGKKTYTIVSLTYDIS